MTRLTLQKNEVTGQINNVRNLVPPIPEIKDKASLQLMDLERHREDRSTRKVRLEAEKMALEKSLEKMQEELLKYL